jgi:hypothetical protein
VVHAQCKLGKGPADAKIKHIEEGEEWGTWSNMKYSIIDNKWFQTGLLMR